MERPFYSLDIAPRLPRALPCCLDCPGPACQCLGLLVSSSSQSPSQRFQVPSQTRSRFRLPSQWPTSCHLPASVVWQLALAALVSPCFGLSTVCGDVSYILQMTFREPAGLDFLFAAEETVSPREFEAEHGQTQANKF